MKILIINSYHYYRAGAEKNALDISNLLVENGHAVHHFSMKGVHNIPCDDSDYFINEIDYRKEYNSINFKSTAKVLLKSIYSFEAKSKLKMLCDKIRPDIVHLHSIRHHLTKSFFPVLKKSNIPVVWTLHDYKEICPNTTLYNGKNICEACKDGNYFNAVKYRCKKGSVGASMVTCLEAFFNGRKSIANTITKYISPSHFLRNKLIEYGYDPEKIEVLPNFIFSEKYTNKQSNLRELLYLGRIEKEKGVFTLLRAFEKVSKIFPDVKLNVAGEGTSIEKLLSYIRDNEIDNVNVLGHVTGKRLNDLLDCASVIIIPSEWYENYPYSALEAMAMSKPIIGSRIGGIPEIVEDNKNGYLFQPGCAADLEEKIKRFLFLTDECRIMMGCVGRRRVETKNDPDDYIKKLLDIYKSCVAM